MVEKLLLTEAIKQVVRARPRSRVTDRKTVERQLEVATALRAGRTCCGALERCRQQRYELIDGFNQMSRLQRAV